jgi:hypothetical protein
MRHRKLPLLLAAAVVLGGLLAAPLAPKGVQQSDRITVDELKALVAEGKPVVILDVRGHVDTKIKGATHIPLDQVEARASELPHDREIVTYCA